MLSVLKGASAGWLTTAMVVHFAHIGSVTDQFFWLAASAAAGLSAFSFKE